MRHLGCRSSHRPVLGCASVPSARASAVRCHHSAKGALVMPDTPIPAGIPASSLQVIGAGFGRTGTASLRDALERLGFGPCDHMRENFAHPERFPLWEAALRCKDAGEPIDWRPLLDGFRAIMDFPGAYFWRELIAAHPDAKVILTIRDPERWYDSAQATIFSVPQEQMSGVAQELDRTRIFGDRLDDRAHCQAVFTRHNQVVQEMVPPERLLVFDVKEGWEPLCAFLDFPVSEAEPFPPVHAAAAFQDEEKRERRERAKRSLNA